MIVSKYIVTLIMAKSMSKAWILDSFVELLKEKETRQKDKFNLPAKVVQVIKTNYEHGYLVLSDTKHCITAFLTRDEKRRLEMEGRDSQEKLNELKNSLIRLEKDSYVFTTVIQCAGDRVYSKLLVDVRLPVSLQCNRITYFSAHDTGVMGEPNDVNMDAKFLGIRQKLTYSKLLNVLTLRQYPNERCLPDCNGQLLLPPKYDANNPILINHCLISDHQKTALDQIDTFDHSKNAASGSSSYSINASETLKNHDSLDELSSQQMGRGARKKTKTQFYSQSLQFTQTDEVDDNFASESQTVEINEDITFFTQPRADLTQDYMHGLSAMLASQPEKDKDELVGSKVKKFFKNYGWFDGVVVKRTTDYYLVEYSDGDREGYKLEELKKILVSNNSEDDGEVEMSSQANAQTDKSKSSKDVQQDKSIGVASDNAKKDKLKSKKDDQQNKSTNALNSKSNSQADDQYDMVIEVTSNNSQKKKTKSKDDNITKSKDDTNFENNQRGHLTLNDEGQRKRKYESMKKPSQLGNLLDRYLQQDKYLEQDKYLPCGYDKNGKLVKSSQPEKQPDKESAKKSSTTPKEIKSKTQAVYDNPDFQKILNSLQTSKYLPCGYDENGKLAKSTRVIL